MARPYNCNSDILISKYVVYLYNYHHKWRTKSSALQALPKEGNFPILRGSKGDLFPLFFFDFSLMRKVGGYAMARPCRYFFQQIDFVGFLYHFFYYFCIVVRTEARTGGRRAIDILKGVESTSYLRRIESGKFKSPAR